MSASCLVQNGAAIACSKLTTVIPARGPWLWVLDLRAADSEKHLALPAIAGCDRQRELRDDNLENILNVDLWPAKARSGQAV